MPKISNYKYINEVPHSCKTHNIKVFNIFSIIKKGNNTHTQTDNDVKINLDLNPYDGFAGTSCGYSLSCLSGIFNKCKNTDKTKEPEESEIFPKYDLTTKKNTDVYNNTSENIESDMNVIGDNSENLDVS